jgi:hypothetical protein
LLWLLKLFLKGWLFELHQNSLVLHAQPFRDIIMITRNVVMKSPSAVVNEQYGLCSQQKRKASKPIDDITTASNIHYGLTRKEVMKLAYQFEGTEQSIPTHGM